MSRWRRSAWLLLYCHDGAYPDLRALFEGRAALERRRQLYGLSILTGREEALGAAELEALLALPCDEWADEGESAAAAAAADLDALARRGLVLSDADAEPFTSLRRREEELDRTNWNVYGALYHFMTRWREVDLRAYVGGDEAPAELPLPSAALVASFVKRYGPPPSPFKRSRPDGVAVELPLRRGRGGLYDALGARRTTRGFDRSRPLPFDELALVLYEVFGCHGTAPILGEHFGLRKSSPSGGGLHPIEVYPLVTAVDGLEPGLYHYDVERHGLEPLEALDAEAAAELASGLTCGQTYFGSAHVSLILTARFERTFWKYRGNQRALTAVLVEVGHFSQSLYLVSAERGLGAYVTTAVNAAAADERLGFEGVAEGTVALAGFGMRRPERSPLEPEFRPYTPRRPTLS